MGKQLNNGIEHDYIWIHLIVMRKTIQEHCILKGAQNLDFNIVCVISCVNSGVPELLTGCISMGPC